MVFGNATTRSSFPGACGALLLWGALAVPAVMPAGAQPAQQQPPVFGEKVEVTTVDVLVLDDGRPVPGLTRQDFTVEEDGVVQAITSFDAIGFAESEASEAPKDLFVASNTAEQVRPGRAFLVIYDDVHLTALGARLAQSQFAKLIDGLGAGDVVSVLTTSNRVWWTARLPEGKDDLVAFAQSVKGAKPMDLTTGRISDYEAMQISRGRDPQVLGIVARRYFESGLIVELTPPQEEGAQYRRELDVSYGLPLIKAKAQEVYDAAAQRAVASLEVMKRAIAALGTERGRKAVLVLSEGFVFDSTRTELRDLVRGAREANAVLYFFDARGSAGPNAPGHAAENWRALEERDFAQTALNFARDSEGTESAALDTGGRVVKGTDNLADAMLRVVQESRTFYLLGYVSTNTKRDGKFRNIKVNVARPGVEVRARKGYYAASKDEKKSPPADKIDPRVRAGLDSPFDSDTIPLRMASYVLGKGPSGKSTVVLAADLGLRAVGFEDKGGRQVAALDTYVVVSPLQPGGAQTVEKKIDLSLPPEVHARLLESGLPILRDFELASGRYQARLLVRDARAGVVGTVRHTFEVPPAEAFHISTPIFSDTLAPSAGGGQMPVPLAHRNFRSGANVFYMFDVYGATTGGGSSEVAIGYVVRRKDGSVFAQSADRAVVGGGDGASSHRLTLPLKGAEPGEYELLLTVTDKASGNRLERRDAFVVDPA